jgi:hypothetical protein
MLDICKALPHYSTIPSIHQSIILPLRRKQHRTNYQLCACVVLFATLIYRGLHPRLKRLRPFGAFLLAGHKAPKGCNKIARRWSETEPRDNKTPQSNRPITTLHKSHPVTMAGTYKKTTIC